MIAKPRKKDKYTVAGVQKLFNDAIRRRDEGICVTCKSEEYPQASHFNEVGGAPGLRFYPPNVHCQCAKCHINVYHNTSPWPYTRWMTKNIPEFGWMEDARGRAIRYTQTDLETIAAYCRSDKLDYLAFYIEIMYRKIGVADPEKTGQATPSDDDLIKLWGK